HGAEGAADFGLRYMLETEIGAAGGAAAAGLDFACNGVGREITRQDVTAVAAGVRRRIILLELTHLGIEQLAAELVAERIPHDRVHADQPRREMADGEELHELHVD